jgi:hypothetical protein
LVVSNSTTVVVLRTVDSYLEALRNQEDSDEYDRYKARKSAEVTNFRWVSLSFLEQVSSMGVGFNAKCETTPDSLARLSIG